MTNHRAWVEAPPVVGSHTTSMFTEVPNLRIDRPSVAQKPPTTLCYGWIQYPDGSFIADDFSASPGWVGRELVLDDQPDPEALEISTKLAKGLVEWARVNTFKSFTNQVLGVTVEYSDVVLVSPDYTDPDDLDSIPHLDWVNQDEPSVIALGARGLLNVGYVGRFRYLGDSKLDGDITKYQSQTANMRELHSGSRRLHAADARRGLHNRPVISPGYTPKRRTFVRSFISRRADIS